MMWFDRALDTMFSWKGWTVMCLAALALGAWGGWTARDWKQGRADAEAAKGQIVYRDRIIERERAQVDVSADVDARSAAEQVRIRTVTQTIIKEVPVYVSAETDARYSLPVGLVRLHDAAAAGRPLSDTAGVADDPARFAEASDVAPSRFAGVIAENYGTCLADAARFGALQDWVRLQQALANEP